MYKKIIPTLRSEEQKSHPFENLVPFRLFPQNHTMLAISVQVHHLQMNQTRQGDYRLS